MAGRTAVYSTHIYHYSMVVGTEWDTRSKNTAYTYTHNATGHCHHEIGRRELGIGEGRAGR